MKIVREFPTEVRSIEHLWIKMPDGCRLAARAWLPASADAAPVPAILEYIPYRKRDGTRMRDEPMHHWFAGHGYAALRVDVRGSGDSDGLLQDEYTEQELDDARAVLRWIAAQPWCDGSVGMMGKSWGGINALQVAALQPPELKAVISVCSTDDRYADDAHYMGGCLLLENFSWSAVLFTGIAQPPDPELCGDGWRRSWMARLENEPDFAETWLRHPQRDAYWKHGSVCEDYAAIRCPVYAIGGWADAYSNAVPRLLAGLRTKAKGLIGPWAHVYPHDGIPGPAIGFLQEAKRWWDQHLLGRPGVPDTTEDEPAYRVWMQAGQRPRSYHEARNGRWVAERSWPSSRIQRNPWSLDPGLLTPGARNSATTEDLRLDIRSPQSTGLNAGSWCAFGVRGELPGDQREDDGKSLVFDSAPMSDPYEILGAPELQLALTADRPLAFVVARLNDVAPDGSSTRVSYGVLNLTHRDGHEAPQPLHPGQRYDVRVRLNDAAHSFGAGHRLRLALSTCYWPIIWPSPEPVLLGVFPAASELTLPHRPPDPDDAALRPFLPPESAPSPPHVDVDPGGIKRTITRDVTTGETVLTIEIDLEDGVPAMTRLEDIGLEHAHGILERFSILDGDPLSARVELRHSVILRRLSGTIRIETTTHASADSSEFHLETSLDAWEGEQHTFSRTWRRSVERHGV